MYKNLTLTNFRGFRRFTMENLGRINLLVGTNNCGKTTVLEALDLLAEYPDPVGLGWLSGVRGALSFPSGAESEANARLVLRHLFFGHKAEVGSQFVIEGQHSDQQQRVVVEIQDRLVATPGGQATAVQKDGIWLFQHWEGRAAPVEDCWVRLTANAEWPMNDYLQRTGLMGPQFHIQHVGPGGSSRDAISRQLSDIALNPEEQLVLRVLQTLLPQIEGVTTVSAPVRTGVFHDRAGIYVKLKGQRERVPIGTLGDGLWRLLGLALALVRARGSVLLVDEIEIGLHYTAQVDMWRMVKQAAEELDVQVFATTHSRDCILALAAIARPDVTTGSEVTIQRIEGERAISYSEREIVLAAERGIEVR